MTFTSSWFGMATCYGSNSSGARIYAGVHFGHGADPASCTSTGTFPEAKRPVCCVNYAPPSSAEVKESVEQHVYYLLQLSFQSILAKLMDEINDSQYPGMMRRIGR
jgi:hypothetical protein